MLKLLLLSPGLGLLAGHATPADVLVLAAPNKTLATIILPAKSGVPIHFAAQELQKYVEQMTGIRLNVEDEAAGVEGPKVLLTSGNWETGKLGNWETGKLGPNFLISQFPNFHSPFSILPPPLRPPVGSDAFLIRTVGNTLVIAGGCDRAVLFGVYAFLERVGSRWFGPGEEYVPSVDALEIPPLEVSEAPALKWRALELIAGSNTAAVDWMAKARLNVAWPETYTPLTDLQASEESMKAAAVPAMIERGLTIFWGGHVLPFLFSQEKYADHPEYFAQVQGKRLDPAVDFQARAQLCTSNPEVMRILTENTIAFLRHHPWIDVLFLWGNDTTQWCECDSCRALEPQPDKPSPFGGLDRSATYCRMIKVVNEGVQRELPGRKIAFNHYYNLEDLPVDQSVPAAGSIPAKLNSSRRLNSSEAQFCPPIPFYPPWTPTGSVTAIRSPIRTVPKASGLSLSPGCGFPITPIPSVGVTTGRGTS
jgi:hypothetical protein